ncbi:uncharacterized protein TRUGW13939_02940 [Talaromyces rugulosus]|uniref:Uncharacterized protein n=1 Tax=Talaromyces rugulosus TaxID=121627 RepID=A0A7H8QPL3_TALRU|nr:uncharacterized protein TRUGW13939_02940 [Talaromyces rugulosus]QKX55842.1 hypothetical protein TRUGW13939_02940 [Talaromyces rugulosus]
MRNPLFSAVGRHLRGILLSFISLPLWFGNIRRSLGLLDPSPATTHSALTSSIKPPKEAIRHRYLPISIDVSTSHGNIGPGRRIDNIYSGLGASIARMVKYIEVELGGYSALISDHYRTETQAYYFLMLEAGLSVVVANLPSLWLFFTSILPEKVANSVHSISSLSSLELPWRSDRGSNSSANAAGHDASISINNRCLDVSSGLAQISHCHLVVEQSLHDNPKGQAFEAIKLHNVAIGGSQEQMRSVAEGQIIVENTIRLALVSIYVLALRFSLFATSLDSIYGNHHHSWHTSQHD